MDDSTSDGPQNRTNRDRHLDLVTAAHGTVRFDLALTMGRQILVERRGSPDALRPDEVIDALALATVEVLGGKTYRGQEGVAELRQLSLQITADERRSFAQAYLAFNDHLLCKAETRITESGGIKQHTVTHVPRTDVAWHEDPVQRLHQAWSIHQKELRESLEALDRPFKVLDKVDGVARDWTDPLSKFGIGKSRDISGLFGRFADPLATTKISAGLTDAGADLRRKLNPLEGILPKEILTKRRGILDDFEPSITRKLGLLDKAMGLSELPGLGGSAAKFLREDRDRWSKLRGIDGLTPGFSKALSFGESAFASVASKLATQGLGTGRLYEAVVHRPTTAFASYVEESRRMALGGDRRVREILDAAVARGAEHFLATSEVTARLVEHRRLEEIEEALPEDSILPPLDLLASERDDLVGRARLDENVPVEEIAAANPVGRLADLVQDVLTLICECNEVALLHGGENVFEPRNRVLRAFADLPQLLPRDLNSFGDAIDHLFFVLYEGAGSTNLRFVKGNGRAGVFDNSEAAFEAVMLLKVLRNKWLRHDPERGGGGAKATFRDVQETLAALGCASMPRSAEDFRRAYEELLKRLHAFLLELRVRLDAIPFKA